MDAPRSDVSAAPAVREVSGPAAPPRRVSVFAAIVSLLAVAGAVLLGVFGQPIDAHRGTALLAEPIEIAAWAAAEHDRCLTDVAHLQNKLTVRSLRALDARIGGLTNQGARLIDLLSGAGYQFLGAGPTGIPAEWAGSHLVFVSGLQANGELPAGRDAGTGLSLLSVMFIPNAGQFGGWADDSAAVLELNDLPARGSGRLRTVRVRSDGHVIYFVTGGVPGEIADIFREWTAGG